MGVRFITEYQNFIIEEFHNKRNTVNKDLSFIKRVFIYAVQQELIKDDLNPFNKIVLHSEPTNRSFLSIAEISLLEDFKGSELEIDVP
jgi:site-specific recombinase XerD